MSSRAELPARDRVEDWPGEYDRVEAGPAGPAGDKEDDEPPVRFAGESRREAGSWEGRLKGAEGNEEEEAPGVDRVVGIMGPSCEYMYNRGSGEGVVRCGA
jgi:hypothetical protein